MKRSEHGTTLDTDPKHRKPAQPARATGTNPHDAREDRAQLEENRRELGVDETHRTGKMKQRRRGTYP
jgi:hypothetical protein